MVVAYPDLPHQKSIPELLTVEICSREAPISGISVEVLSEKLHCLEYLWKFRLWRLGIRYVKVEYHIS